MHKKLKKLSLILFAVILTACSSIVLHTDSPYFTDQTGIKVLNTDILLCQKEEVISKNNGLIKFRVWKANGRDKCLEPFGKTIAKINKGAKIEILEIEEHKHLNLYQFQHWYFISEIKLKDEIQKAYYYYSLTTTSPNAPELPKQLLWN